MKTSPINEIITKSGTEITIPADTDVFSELDTCNHFIFVREGCVKVYKISEEGKELVLYRVNPDNLCILTTTCVLSGSSYPANGKTETPVRAVLLKKKDFDSLVVENSDFREFVFSSLSNRFSGLVSKIDEISFRTLQERLVRFIHEMKNTEGEIPMTHQEIANELGTNREIISRLLKKLEKEGKLELTRGLITVKS